MKLYLDGALVKAFKLQGNLEFQGLSIAVENKAGSSRHWKDENSGESGSTKMKYPYGYVRGTLGVDGDAVDVFVGPNETSDKVYVITQMKKPGFDEVDEQKVMLGFISASAAKKAYLDHYTNSRFFGSMKEFTMSEFKEKLESHRGKLIKHLYLAPSSATLEKVVAVFEHVKKGNDMDEKNVEKSCEHSKSVTCEKCNGTHSTTDILKGITARMLSITKRAVERAAARQDADVPPTEDVTLYGPQIAQALHVDRPFEPPAVPVVFIPTPPPSASPLAPDFMTSCVGCGYTHKSLSTCPRCEAIAATNREAAPIWRR